MSVIRKLPAAEGVCARPVIGLALFIVASGAFGGLGERIRGQARGPCGSPSTNLIGTKRAIANFPFALLSVIWHFVIVDWLPFRRGRLAAAWGSPRATTRYHETLALPGDLRGSGS